MGMSIDDNVKKQLLDKLSEEPPMVLSIAYAYAKNYVKYGEDITKAWTTAVQQASILEKVRQQAWTDAYGYFKEEYENRLKADMVAMLTDIQLEIEELKNEPTFCHHYKRGVNRSSEVIQQKIDVLKAESEEI